MMIIQDEQRLKEEESIMIGDDSFTGKDEEINDFALANQSLFKSANRRKQIKPNRVTTDDEEQQPTDLSNGHQSPLQSYSKKDLVSPNSSIENHEDVNLPSASFSNDQPLPLIPSQRSTTTTPTKTNEKSSEDYCEICQKHFCNKYYLRKHKGECHGVYTDYIKSLQKSSNESPVKSNSNRSSSSSIPIPTNTLLLNPFYPGPSDIKSLFPIPSSSSANANLPLPLSTSSPKSSPQRTIRRCHICQQEFRNRALFRMHMNTFHPNEKAKKLSSIPSPSTANLGFLPSFVDTSSQLAQKLVTGQTPQASYGIVNDSYFSAKMADRVVCEICNKQVCNKYFLKTHKAKVHGITSNDPPEQMNDNLENSETYCSICKKDFSTKYFYLFHMQTVHNDTSDPAYQTLLHLMKNAASVNENANPFFSLSTAEPFEDESDGNTENCKRKRTASQSSSEKRFAEANTGLQPFLLESEDPKFSHTFVPCMVYLPVIRRVTQQVKINLRLKPVLAENSS